MPVPEESKYCGPIAYFVDSVLAGTEPTVTGADARCALEVVMGVYRSSKVSRAVKLPLPRGGEE